MSKFPAALKAAGKIKRMNIRDSFVQMQQLNRENVGVNNIFVHV